MMDIYSDTHWTTSKYTLPKILKVTITIIKNWIFLPPLMINRILSFCKIFQELAIKCCFSSHCLIFWKSILDLWSIKWFILHTWYMMICKFVRQTKSYGRVGHPENFLGVNLQKPTRNIAQIMNMYQSLGNLSTFNHVLRALKTITSLLLGHG